jgi:hypothetical protein
MAAHCAKRPHHWFYIWTLSHDAPPGHGGKMDHFSIAGDFRIVVVEGAFVAQAAERETANGNRQQTISNKENVTGYRLHVTGKTFNQDPLKGNLLS